MNLAAFNGYVPQLGDEYMIIKNGPEDDPDAVIGTFAGLPEGYVFTNFLGSGLSARISYKDGDGNDVVISTFLPAEIGDRVWVDLNGDGIQDQDEPGFEGVTVTLTGTDAWGNPVSRTDDHGQQRKLPVQRSDPLPGTYTVTVSNPGGYSFSPQYRGGNDALDSDVDPSGVTAPVTVASNQSNLTIDAGLVPQAAGISLVKAGMFQDENADGNADLGETIRYAFTVTNTGNVTLSNVTLADTVGGVTVNGGPLATLAVGAVDSTTFTGSYTITQADIDAGTFHNVALVTGTSPGGPDVTDSATADTPLPQAPSIGWSRWGRSRTRTGTAMRTWARRSATHSR